MTIQTKQEDNKFVLLIEGRIDSNSSTQLQDSVLLAFDSSNHIVLDFKDVAYISSAGLRVLLLGQKKAGALKSTMELTNVSEVVMQVLDTVGFSKILTII